MTFCEQLIQEEMPLWLSFADLPFLDEMVQGTLDHAKFARYLIQDTQYLAAFAKIYAWSFLKTDDIALMKELYQEMGIIVADETQQHVKYLAGTGLDAKEVMAQEMAPECKAYIDCMTEAARHGSLALGIFAAGPCNFSYYYLVLELKRRMEAAGGYENNYFRDWLSYYISDAYKAGCDHYLELCNMVGNDLSSEEQTAVRNIFHKCSEYEGDFWNMAYKG